MKCRLSLLACLFAGVCATVAQPISSPTQYREQIFDVEHYELDLTLRTPSTKRAQGRVDVHVRWTSTHAAPSLPLHARGITIDSVTLRGQRLTTNVVGTPTLDTFHVRVDRGQPVQAGQRDTMRVYYSGTMTSEGGSSPWGGVWYEGTVLYALGVGFANPNVSATQHWMPCYDHPSDKATFRGTFRIPRSWTCASTGVMIGDTIPDGDTLRAITWDERHATATYLLTFAVGPFVRLNLNSSTSPHAVPHEAYSLAADSAASRISYSLVPAMTAAYESLFGPYPFDKVGYVNTRRGAMEHQTMISLPVSIVQQRDSMNSTIAHELVHQWFGDLVSPQDFRHAWLTEAFATYGEAAWIEHRRGQQAYLDELASSVNRYVTSIATQEGVLPLVDFPRSRPSSNYPETIYRKGQIVVAMMRTIAGDSAFYAALRTYLATHAYGTATTAEFREAIRPALGSHTDAFFDQWTEERGWPRVDVILRAFDPQLGSQRVIIEQRQHVDRGWPVFTAVPLPVTYRNLQGQEIDTLLMMTDTTLSVDLPATDGIRINSGRYGRSLVQVVQTTTVHDVATARTTLPSFSLYPNPAVDSAVLEREELEDAATIDLMDAQGRVLFSAPITSGQRRLELSLIDLSAGMYIVRCSAQHWVASLPLVIER